MPAELDPDFHLEIAHVLFMDIVGFSKLLINEQAEVLQELNRIVRSTDQFRKAEAAEELIRLPTGDGMVLVFLHSPEAPVQCAVEISRALRNYPQLRLRMGIHSGPVRSALAAAPWQSRIRGISSEGFRSEVLTIYRRLSPRA